MLSLSLPRRRGCQEFCLPAVIFGEPGSCGATRHEEENFMNFPRRQAGDGDGGGGGKPPDTDTAKDSDSL